jgi:phosphate transport system protein
MSIHLDRDLEALQSHILSMCIAVKEVVDDAVDELAKPDPNVSRAIANADDEIDHWDVQVEADCLKILALHQPAADNLRRVAAIMKIAVELERVGDIAVNIAERALGLLGAKDFRIPSRLPGMAQLALNMLRMALDSFVKQDVQMARSVCIQDEQVDQLNREIIDELVQRMKESPELVEPSLHLFSATRHIERVADHATNIAEDVLYLVEGSIVRHQADLRRA